MSEHKESLVKVLEYIVNDEQDKAADLLHNVFVEKAKSHWASITENDEVVEDEIQEEDSHCHRFGKVSRCKKNES